MIELYKIGDIEEFIDNFSGVDQIIDYIKEYFDLRSIRFKSKVIQVVSDCAYFIYELENGQELRFKLLAPDYILNAWREGEI